MGRWTREEHNKFIDGLRKYGKNWKLIEDYVNTRSGSQIRSHAQKFFSRLEKQCHISKSEVFKYLDKISNDLLEFNSENEMLRKRKIWEVIKASNIDNCKGKANSVDAQVVQEKLNTLTANLECVMGGSSQILDPNARDKYQHGKFIANQAWKEITKSIVEITQDLATEIDREST